MLIATGLLAIGYLVVIFGIPTGAPDFASVYETRSAYDAVASSAPAAGYIVSWAGNVVFPLLIAWGLARGRPVPVILGAAGALFIYATGGFKSVLFSIALVPAIHMLIRLTRRWFGPALAWGGAGVVFGSVLATILTGSIWPLALFVTRLIAVPGQMAAYYVDFFSLHPTYSLSRSFLASFNRPPYDVEAPSLIGAIYLGDAGINANANLWADAMANYGLLGIVPFTLVLGIVLWVLDSAGARRDVLVIGPTLGLIGITLGNSGVFTTIMTLGLGLIVAFLALTREDAAVPSSSHPAAA
jgi:hypothetical protein